MDDIAATLLSLFLVPVAGLASWALSQLATFLRALAKDKNTASVARTAAMVGARVTSEIDQAIDFAASETQGLLAKAQLPESLGGTRIVGEEWDVIRDALVAEVKAGLGQDWLGRLMDVLGVGVSVDAHLTKAVESRFTERSLAASAFVLDEEEVDPLGGRSAGSR